MFGSAEQVAEQIKTKVLDAGVDGVILSPVTSLSGYHPGGITAVGEALKPLVARINSALDVGNNTAKRCALSAGSGGYRSG